MKSIRQCLLSIKRSNSIAIISHTTPDADALASSMALMQLIKTNLDKKNEKIALSSRYIERGNSS